MAPVGFAWVGFIADINHVLVIHSNEIEGYTFAGWPRHPFRVPRHDEEIGGIFHNAGPNAVDINTFL